MISLDCYHGAKVLVTGHAGFKGTHLSVALEALGATVYGYDRVNDHDVRDAVKLVETLARIEPDFVFHLAAQAFVPVGWEDPLTTFQTNAQGTVNLLEALRRWHGVCSVVVVTTDKVYGEGNGGGLFQYAFHETDPLVGLCPYSSSKVAAEHAVAAYRALLPRKRIATARAGNVVGPGDWGRGRLVPNAVRALHSGIPIPVFHEGSVRPWQYVEDVIDGYLRLGAALHRGGADFEGPFNFGPEKHHTVREVVERVLDCWGSGSWAKVETPLHEVNELRVASVKARHLLGWRPRWSFDEMIEKTIKWYRDGSEG